ncbi:RNA polymerase sigma-70 factor, ECF subfamily [Zobellia uliginosa]|uniref:RNA polymerase sigma factor n=1 Tax=Zobellia uliginosa TaxID=143224 RepID=A0ABY1KXX4_9FLAO|nr:RNA polymerase sigma-70 factor, ECF subfamily [Zobellia uliginosa]
MFFKRSATETYHLDKKVIYIDEKLVSKLQKGDEHAYELLFNKYHKDIYRYAYSLIKSKEHAEEVVQEVFVKVWLKRAKLKPELSFKSFLFTIAKNTAYDFLVKASKDQKLKQHVFNNTSVSYSPVENYMLNTEYELLKEKAINSLPPKRKLIFEMSRNEGKSYQDISSELGITTQTVKNQMSQALGSISAFLESYGGITFMLLQIPYFF